MNPIGDKAFRQVYDRHAGPLFRFVYRFTENREAAEEILHDTFIQLLSGKFKADSDSETNGSLKSWLYTVARNRSLNYRKKLSYEVKDDATIAEAASVHDQEDHTITADLMRRLAFAESGLPQDLSETWHLRKQGVDNAEISKRLSIPVGTVKSRFFRLVEHLKREFKNEI